MDDASLMGNGRIEPAHSFSYSASAVACNAGTENAYRLKVSEVFVDLFRSFALRIAPPLDALEIFVPIDQQTLIFSEPGCIDDEMAPNIRNGGRQRRMPQKMQNNTPKGPFADGSGLGFLLKRAAGDPATKSAPSIQLTIARLSP